MKPEDFAGKSVYVVGGSMGIGLAAAKRAAALGAHVCLFARRREPLERAAAAVRGRQRDERQRTEYRELDVAEHRQVDSVMEACVTTFGAPDVLLNCAGRAIPHHFEDIAYAQFRETMRINLYGCWNTTAALVPHMRRRGSGYIVNTSSLAGLFGVFGFTDYCASKFALVGFSEALRSELKPYGITVSVLCPPDADTPGFAQENKTKPAETKAISAGAKLMTAEAVADELFAGMAKGGLLIIPGRDGRLNYLVKRFAPGFMEWYMNRIIAKVQARPGARG